jgi:predicted nucleotidyltransferase
MRLEPDHATFIRDQVRRFLPAAKVYLFGSRVRDDGKGGDIDILVIAGRPLSLHEMRAIRIAYYKRFEERKLDIASFSEDDPSPFKELSLEEALPL